MENDIGIDPNSVAVNGYHSVVVSKKDGTQLSVNVNVVKISEFSKFASIYNNGRGELLEIVKFTTGLFDEEIESIKQDDVLKLEKISEEVNNPFLDWDRKRMEKMFRNHAFMEAAATIAEKVGTKNLKS